MGLLFFPDWLIGYANAFALLIVGHLAETEYVSRIALFTNGVALTVHTVVNLDGGFFGSGIIGAVVSLYALLGFCAGTIGIVAYWGEESLPQIYYDLNYFTYRSETVAAFILLTGVLQHIL
jgi:hypothetical protein